MVCYINTAYVQVNINTDVREPVIVGEAVLHVMVNMQNVIAQQITLGVAVRVHVGAVSNIVVAEPDIVEVRERFVEEST